MYHRFIFLALSTLFLSILLMGETFAQSREFQNPQVRGVRLDFCKHQGGKGCGKPAADLFCKEMNYSRSIGHRPDPRTGERLGRTLIFGDGALCKGVICRAFSSILCIRDEVFKTPVPKKPKVPKKKVEKKPAPKKPAPKKPKKKKNKKPETAKQSQPKLTLPKNVAVPTSRPKTETANDGEAKPEDNFVITPLKLNKNLPSGALLTRCVLNTSNCPDPVTSHAKVQPDGTNKIKRFQWSISQVPKATVALWQVSTKPFPAFAGEEEDTQFDGLVKWSVVANPKTNSGEIEIDFGKVEEEASLQMPPESFYVRIIPFSGLLNGKAMGLPSNVIQVYYAADKPAPPEIDLTQLQEDVDTYVDPKTEPLFSFRIKSFKPPEFDKGNKWGCVVVIEHPEAWNVTGGFIGQINQNNKLHYPIGSEVCPRPYRGGSGKVNSVGDFFDLVFEAWDWVGNRYDDLVDVAVQVVLYATPIGRECKTYAALVSKVGIDGADEVCNTGARIAVNSGMVALGVPPTIPSYNELVDQGVDYAVELAVDEFEARTGVPCFGPCEDAFRLGFEELAEELKRQPDRTACVDPAEAHKHGREPMCLPEGLLVRPAPGTQYEVPVAEIEITRRKGIELPWGVAHPDCYAFASLEFENFFPGGIVYGKTAQQSIQVKPQNISGELFGAWRRKLNLSMDQGKTIIAIATFSPAVKHQFPWTKKLWSTSQIIQRDEQGPYGPNWFQLFLKSQMTITAGSNCSENAAQLQMTMPDW